MALDLQTGGKVKVTISKRLERESARKTLQRLFLSDEAFRAPYDARRKNFVDKPKRRGGRIYTKYARNPVIDLDKGTTATVAATPQHVRDLQSVERYVTVEAA